MWSLINGTRYLLIIAAAAVCSSGLAQQPAPASKAAPAKDAPSKAAPAKDAPSKAAEKGATKPSLFARHTVGMEAMLTSFSGPQALSCSAIMKEELIYDQFRKMSSRTRVQQFYDWACFSNFQTASEMRASAVSLGIPIEGIPIKFDFSDNNQTFQQSLTRWCRTTMASLNDQATFEQFERAVDQGMVSAYKACIDAQKDVLLKQNGAFAYATPQDDYLRKYSVVLEMRPPSAGQLNQIHSIESPEVACTIGGKPIPPNYKTSLMTISMVCTKSVDEGRVLSFNTNANASVPIKLPGFQEGVIVELKQKVTGLSQALAIARDALNARVSGIHLEAGGISPLGPAFGCGQEGVGSDSQTFMVGSRDGTGCGVPNQNFGRRLDLVVPK